MATYTEGLVEDDERPMTLNVAIALVSTAPGDCKINDYEEAIGLVVAAAQAFACKKCDGKGRVLIAVADSYIDCNRCKGSRLLLKGRM